MSYIYEKGNDMKQILFMVMLLGFTLLSAMTKKINHQQDDWEYNASVPASEMLSSGVKQQPQTSSRALPTMMAAPVAKGITPTIGMSVGGAKDSKNFEENIKNGYLPKLDSITYEGQFYQHYFDTGMQEECKTLFCPSYSSAKRVNLFSKEEEIFLSVGLNSGIKANAFHRKKLNLVVVLDISGSMGGRFDRYFYDPKKPKKSDTQDSDNEKKIEVATKSMVAMLSHLNDDDRVGVVLFDNNAYLAKPLRLVGLSDKKAIRDHILELRERGGTNWSAGYKKALELFKGIDRDPSYENRIIFLTDAMPNRGELSKDKLFGLAKKASQEGIHTTFVGVGVDFNTDLVEYVSKTKGANYFSVHSAKEFRELLDEEFEYMVTPLVYDLRLKLESKGYEIEAVYGSPDAKLATGEVMYVNTLFPSKQKSGKTKGGVVLLKLKRTGKGKDHGLSLHLSYTDIEGKSFSNEQKVQLKDAKESYFDNSGIRKAILLSDYVTLMKNWIIDARAGCNDQVKWIMEDFPSIMKRCMVFPPKRALYPLVKTWERSSCALRVSEGYHQLFERFSDYYRSEMKVLNDDSLNQELSILEILLKVKPEPFKKEIIDDWKFKQ